MTNWEMICDYVLNSDDCKNIHKMAYPSGGWIYISEADGSRHKITDKWTIDEVRSLVKTVRKGLKFYQNVNGIKELMRNKI